MRSSVGARGGSPRAAGVPRRHSPAYSRIEQLIQREQCVILDGGISTELEGLDIPGFELRDDARSRAWMRNRPVPSTPARRA